MEITAHILTDFKTGKIGDFYTEVYPSLLTFAARYLGADYGFLAEDCVQEAVFKAYHQRESFNTPMQFKSFLYTCVHNNSISVLRKHQSRNTYLTQQRDYDEDFTNSIIEQETLDLLYAAIERLPADLHAVFELSFEQGLKNAEVAQRLGVSESAVKKKKARMISLLRDMFAGDEAMLSLLSSFFILN